MSRGLYVDAEECIGCRVCIDLCPDVFTCMEAICQAVVVNPDGGSEQDIQEAMDTCPVQCIHWE